MSERPKKTFYISGLTLDISSPPRGGGDGVDGPLTASMCQDWVVKDSIAGAIHHGD
jgi:hypothetical protein